MNTLSDYPLLNNINTPADVRKLSKAKLKALAKELRDYLTHTVSISGGHFSAGLGTVELTVALHYVFDTPSDQLVWDVGHQAYPHKILTGRKERMTTIGVEPVGGSKEEFKNYLAGERKKWAQVISTAKIKAD